MPKQIYEVIAQGARYWFLFLMALIVWRSYRWLAKDRKQRKKRLRLLPDAGYVGELVVQTGSGMLPQGTALPVASEGVLGSGRGCDLVVPVRGVGIRHLWFRYEDGEGLMMRPASGRRFTVDGEEVAGRRKMACVAHGSRLKVGEAVLRLRMFEGFETVAYVGAQGRRRALPVDREEEEEPETPADSSEGTPASMPSNGMPAGNGSPAAMTPEQLMLWQANQQQWQAWMLAQQAVAAQQAALRMVLHGQAMPPAEMQEPEQWEDDEAHREPEEDWAEEDEGDEEETGVANAADETAGYVVLTDSGAVEMPAAGKRSKARGMFSPFEPLANVEAAEPAGDLRQMDFGAMGVFYPPVEDDGFQEDETWPYAPFPKSDAEFENQGYTYPEFVDAPEEDEDLTDAAAPPKSMYVEPDEAERAKKLLWDKYLGGGKKR